jgi:nicotinamide-nucleotide amidase
MTAHEEDTELLQLAAELGERLRASGLMLVTAESCTGGWVAQAITAIAGSSQWFERGYVTYSNAAKQELLGVQDQTLARHGAVSAETAAEMVRGALARSHARMGVSITGIAGPGGGTPEKPVGLVWLGFGNSDGRIETERLQLTGSRASIRRSAVVAALRGLLARVPS